ncbi:aldehyde dehydrogenase family protein, partial [Kitasatospora sp. NPDC059571]|uniref:aldehyde dehydrogenase family protein n=1 Tax=Kitasatospora sp. NPDC059571 TaxID=3346871 RepID=UPI0036A97A82
MTTPTRSDWQARAAALRFETRAFIDGGFRPAASGAVLATTDPATGKVLTEVTACGAADVDRAVRAARTAFD